MRQPRNRQRLQPYAARPGQCCEKNAVPAEDHVLEAAYDRDLEADTALKRAHMAWVHAQGLARLQVLDHDFARKLEPRRADAAHLLQQKAVAAKYARAQRLLKADTELNLFCRAEKSVAMDVVVVSGLHLNGQNVSRHAGGKGDFAGRSPGAVLGHEQAAAAGHALQCAEEPAAAHHLRVGGHIDRARHPRQLAGFGDDAIIGLQQELKNGHGRAHNAALHSDSPQRRELGARLSKEVYLEAGGLSDVSFCRIVCPPGCIYRIESRPKNEEKRRRWITIPCYENSWSNYSAAAKLMPTSKRP